MLAPKPSTVRPNFSLYGPLWSKRTPIFRVRLLLTRQSSCTKPEMSYAYQEPDVLMSKKPWSGRPSRNCAMSCPIATVEDALEDARTQLLLPKLKPPEDSASVKLLTRDARP